MTKIDVMFSFFLYIYRNGFLFGSLYTTVPTLNSLTSHSEGVLIPGTHMGFKLCLRQH